ncbi:hypothetical protein BaRGS_00021494 [Batillaria attramentaria]|uniref:Uncharacterized protein n=1 Tax=Batillaria attramentaria TaxID=370345 RepID=A0ABD0KJU4_9CAEN
MLSQSLINLNVTFGISIAEPYKCSVKFEIASKTDKVYVLNLSMITQQWGMVAGEGVGGGPERRTGCRVCKITSFFAVLSSSLELLLVCANANKIPWHRESPGRQLRFISHD